MIARIGLVAIALASLAACDRSDPPAQQLERAAEELVTEVEGESLPQQAKGRFAPLDECSDDPLSAAFLNRLKTAVEKRDAIAIAELSAQDVRLDFGEGGGQAQLVDRLEANGGELWSEMDDLLALGCASDGTTITLPYYFAQNIPVDDPTGAAIVTGEDVPVYVEANRTTDIVERVSWDVVSIRAEDSANPFINIETSDGTEGFVARENLRMTTAYRLLASRRNNRWRITAIVSGD